MKHISRKSTTAVLTVALLLFSSLPASVVWASDETASQGAAAEETVKRETAGATGGETASDGQKSGENPAEDTGFEGSAGNPQTDTQAPELRGDFNNFKAQYSYSETTFSDVSASDWFSAGVSECYQLALISGRPDNRFDPYDSVSVAEAISMAARSHAVYYGLEIPQAEGGDWYSSAVDYAVRYGIIEHNTFFNYQRPATRAELAYVFYSAFAQADLRIINNVTALPDVTENTPYYEAIYKLYNIGVLSGKDEYGTFYPGNGITRGETAVLLARLTVPVRRQSLTLASFEAAMWNSSIPSDDGLYSVTASIEWSASNPRDSSRSTLEIETYPAERKISGFTVAKSTLSEELQNDLYAYSSKFAGEVAASLKNGQVHSIDNITQDGRNGTLSHITGKASNLPFYYWVQIVDQGDCYIVLAASTAKDASSEASEEIQGILTSLQVAASTAGEAATW